MDNLWDKSTKEALVEGIKKSGLTCPKCGVTMTWDEMERHAHPAGPAPCPSCASKDLRIAVLEKVREAASNCSHGDYCSPEACYCGYDKVEQALFALRALDPPKEER